MTNQIEMSENVELVEHNENNWNLFFGFKFFIQVKVHDTITHFENKWYQKNMYKDSGGLG